MRYKRVNYKEYAEKTTFEQELKRTCSDDSCIVCPQPEPIDDPCCQSLEGSSISRSNVFSFELELPEPPSS